MSASNQQTLADSRANERPPMLEKGNYIPWESRLRRFLDNKLEEGGQMWHSIEKGPYVRPIIPDPDDTRKQIIEPLSKMSEINKKQYIADVRVMNYLLQSIPNDIYNLVRVMYGFDVTNHKFSTPTNNRLRTSSNTKNQAVIQDGRVDIQTKNAGYGGNGNNNAGRQNMNQELNAGNGNDESHYARDCQKPKVCDAKYYREQMLLAMKDVARSNLNAEENDFMLDNSFGDETLEELTAVVIMMARIQSADENVVTEPNNDAKAVSEVNASHKVYKQVNYVKCKTIIHTSDDDQIDSNIIFDGPYVENNGGTSEHDSNAYANIMIFIFWQIMFKEKSKTVQCSKYKETCEELEREIRANKDTIERILKEKDKIESDFFKIENEKIIIQHETQLAKKSIKEQENRYLEDIVDLEEKLSSHDRFVYKMGQSIQTNHVLIKTPNKVYDPFFKAGLGYQNSERRKKAIAVRPKMYHGEMLYNTKLKIDSHDSEKTLEDAEESRLKMRNKTVQLDYEKLNALYETFVPKKEPSVEQTYFSFPSTSHECSESNEFMSDLQISKMLNESKLLKKFENMNWAINDLRDRIGVAILEDRTRRWMSDSQNSLREFYETDVIPMSVSLSKTLKELQQELIEEVKTSHFTFYTKKQAKSKTKCECVESSNSVRRSKSKDTKSKNRVLNNTNDKSSSAHVQKVSSSVSIDSNKRETMNSTVFQSNASVLDTKTVNVVNECSNIVCVSCGKDVFMLSHEKCVAHYALSRDYRVKRSLFTTLVAAKSKNLGATSVVAKSRLSVAKTQTATNKVIQLVLWIVDSRFSKHMTGNLKLLRNFIEKFMGTVHFGNNHFTSITGYRDYVQGNLTICHVYYGDNLLTGSQESNLYTISIFDLASSSPVCLMSKATSTKSWLWHRRLYHFNFGTISQLTLKDLVEGLLKFKYDKDHLCSACEQGKINKASFPPKLVPSTEPKLKLLHMNLCGPMRVESINDKKYILVIVDDYSRYMWIYFLRTKDKAPDMIINFINQVQ
ncbi:retrovirus-related pol polyprotein from transposon TNT 1-94 [Tanacetum coccineum]